MDYSHQVLQGPMRGYVMKEINKPLLKAIITIANRLPVPTRENCRHSNTLILFDAWDKFKKCNKIRTDFIDAIFKILIYKCEVDPVYRFFLNVLLLGIYESDWDYSEQPIPFWEE